MTAIPLPTPPLATPAPERIVVVVDDALAPGLAANAAAVLAFTLGAQLPHLRGPAAAGLGLVALPAFAQQTTDYTEFAAHVARTAGADLRFLALALHGARRPVRRLTGSLPLLR